jgi:glyoxylase-like metal-dependent hydrolase (beta-lactamase superfamily II)
MPARIARRSTLDVGAVRVTYLPDGATRQRPATQFVGAAPEAWEQHGEFLDEEGWLIMSFGSFLIESENHKTLVDLAWGPHSVDLGQVSGGALEGTAFGGGLLESLKAVGIEPTDIDTVLYSHLHIDHVGWATLGDTQEAAFPNAVHVVSEEEWTFWQNPPRDDAGAAPGEAQLSVLGENLRLVQDGDNPVPGVTVFATPGHTAGHASFVIGSGRERAIILGDAVHCPIEFTDPEMSFMADTDGALARRTRARLARDFSGPGQIIAGGHFPHPVFGRLDGPELPQDFRPLG